MPSYHSKFLDTASLVQKASWQVYDGPSLASLTLSAVPTGTFKLAITASAVVGHTNCGSVGTPGTIVINAGTPIQFTQVTKKISTVLLTSIPTITTANLDCHLLIEAIDSGGAPITKETVTSIACLYDDTTKGYWSSEGTWTVNNSRMQSDDVAQAVIGDTIRYLGRDWPIKFISIAKNRYRMELFRTLQF
jgi:hypothetical protein